MSPTDGSAPAARAAHPEANRGAHLAHLDGLRGLAAAYVVCHHLSVAIQFFSSPVPLSQGVRRALAVFNTGQLAVDVFIVLSGYCLMLPVARSGGVLQGGLGRYIQRRARRILPPYYAALVLALVVDHLLGKPPALLDILAHVGLVHNLSSAFNHGLDPPMWSVAMEWQIYFLFPLLLLPVWRRLGVVGSTVVGFAVGLAPKFLFGGYFDWTCPWYLGLFALGMLGASFGFSSELRLLRLRAQVPWGVITIAGGASTLGIALFWSRWYHDHRWISDTIAGVTTTALLILYHAHRGASDGHPVRLLIPILESRLAVALGAFSYSLYLVHYPLLQVFWELQKALVFAPLTRVAFVFVVGFPLLLLLTYPFHLLFERPFMRPASARSH